MSEGVDKIVAEICKTCVLNTSMKYFQDPIQFLADYLLKNNKREDSDREETDDGKTDS